MKSSISNHSFLIFKPQITFVFSKMQTLMTQFTLKRPHKCLFEDRIPDMIMDLSQALHCLYHGNYDLFEIHPNGILHCRFDIIHHPIDIYAPRVHKKQNEYLHIYFRFSQKIKVMYVKNDDEPNFRQLYDKNSHSKEMSGRRFIINECIQYIRYYVQKLVQFRFIYHIESNFPIQIKEKCDSTTKETILYFHHSHFQPFHIIWNQLNGITFHFENESLKHKLNELNLLPESMSLSYLIESDRMEFFDKILTSLISMESAK
jgi:hypothetical protein